MSKPSAMQRVAACVVLFGASAAFHANAQSDVSALSAVSALPVASVVVASSAVVGAVVAVPVVLSTAGAVLVVRTVEVSARGTVYLLERASDGAQTSIEIIGKGLASMSMVAGTAVVVSVVGAGVVLSAAGQAIAFIPNALGRALLHNERVTN